MIIKYFNIFHSKATENLLKLGFLVRKETIWQPWDIQHFLSIFKLPNEKLSTARMPECRKIT
jgi:hypothetical protein